MSTATRRALRSTLAACLADFCADPTRAGGTLRRPPALGARGDCPEASALGWTMLAAAPLVTREGAGTVALRPVSSDPSREVFQVLTVTPAGRRLAEWERSHGEWRALDAGGANPADEIPPRGRRPNARN